MDGIGPSWQSLSKICLSQNCNIMIMSTRLNNHRNIDVIISLSSVESICYRNCSSLSCARILRACLTLAPEGSWQQAFLAHRREDALWSYLCLHASLLPAVRLGRSVCHRVSFVRMNYPQSTKLLSQVCWWVSLGGNLQSTIMRVP